MCVEGGGALSGMDGSPADDCEANDGGSRPSPPVSGDCLSICSLMGYKSKFTCCSAV